MPTHTNVNASQILVAPEYKEDLHNQPIIAELTQHEWELVIHKQMKQHMQTISNCVLQIHNFDREMEILLSETIQPRIWGYSSTRFTKPQASTILKSGGGRCLRWTHIQMDSVQIFISILLDSFNFEEQAFQLLLILNLQLW